MSPRRNSRPQKQPRLRSLQLCPPERRQNQTQTSSLPATAAPYLSHSAVKSRKRARHFTLQHIFCHRCSRGHLIGNAQRFTCPSRSTCLSVRSQQLSLKGSSDRFDRSPSVSCRSHGQQAARITQKDIRKRTKIPPQNAILSVCIPLTEARGARAAASFSSCVKRSTVTLIITGNGAVRLSKLKLDRICLFQSDYTDEQRVTSLGKAFLFCLFPFTV